MPILIPVEQVVIPPSVLFAGDTEITLLQASFNLQAALVFGGATTLVPTGGVIMLEGAAFSGGTSLSMLMGLQTLVSVQFDGDTAMAPTARLNDEPNVFPEVLFEGDASLALSAGLTQFLAVAFQSGTALAASATIERQPDVEFTLFVDVLDSAIVAAQAGNIRRYTARALVDSVEVPVRRAVLEAPENTLGMELQLTLARPLLSLITRSSSVTFQVGIWTGAAYQYVTLISGGKLSARQNTLKNNDGQRPADEVVVSIIDPVADRWNRAPRAPVYLYDPEKVPAPTQSEIAQQRVELDGGGFISPVYTPISGMRLRDVLTEAYVEGCGFAEVVSNIPNFPVREASFSLDGGYDGGVRPLLELFAPMLFADQSNRLFVIDPDSPLPGTMLAQPHPQSATRQLVDSLPQREPVNAILLQFQGADTGGETFTERLEQETSNSGQFGTPAYTSTAVTRRVREYRTVAEPLVVVREEVVDEEVETTDWEFNVIERTNRTDRFDALGRKTGFLMTTDRRLPDLNADGAYALLQNVLRTEQLITYKTNPLDSTQDVQDKVTTVESGLVLVDDGFEYLGEPYRIPLTDAHASGYIDPEGDMHTEQADIRTTTEQLRVRGQQVDVEVRVVNHVSNATQRNSTTSRPGAVTIDRSEQTASRTVLLTVPGTDTEGRRVQTFNAGELPADLAKELGLRRLARLNDPPRQIAVDRTFVDLSIRRGTLLRITGRGEASLGNYIVTGFSVAVEERREGGVVAETSLRARELKQ